MAHSPRSARVIALTPARVRVLAAQSELQQAKADWRTLEEWARRGNVPPGWLRD